MDRGMGVIERLAKQEHGLQKLCVLMQEIFDLGESCLKLNPWIRACETAEPLRLRS